MARLTFGSLAVLVFLPWAAAMPANAASFDCAKATSPDERAICADAKLSSQDEDVTYLYETILPLLKGEQRQDFIDSQREWLQARTQCASDAACLRSQYDGATKRLQALLTSAHEAATIGLFRRTGQCSGCDLSQQDLSGIQPAMEADDGLVGCNVNAVANGTFDRARIDHANFVTCSTKEDSALASMAWDNASLKGTDLAGTNFGGNSFRYADLTEADLAGATLYLVDMQEAKLTRAKLTGAQSEATAMNGLCSSFIGADFSGADLEEAELCGDFRGANFTGAKMRNARISGYAAGMPDNDATDQDLDLTTLSSPIAFDGKVDLTDADLTGATIFDQKGMTSNGYTFAILCRTILPDGTTSDRDCR